MNHTEQFRYCKRCLNRYLNPEQGLVCGITHKKPTFETECPDFTLDENVKVSIPALEDNGFKDESLIS